MVRFEFQRYRMFGEHEAHTSNLFAIFSRVSSSINDKKCPIVIGIAADSPLALALYRAGARDEATLALKRLTFNLNFVNITSSVIDQVACSLVCRTRDPISPLVFEQR